MLEYLMTRAASYWIEAKPHLLASPFFYATLANTLSSIIVLSSFTTAITLTICSFALGLSLALLLFEIHAGIAHDRELSIIQEEEHDRTGERT